MHETTDLYKLKTDLVEIDKLLNSAISNLGMSVGGIDGWAGSWGEYQKLVKIKLKLSTIKERCESAIRRKEKRKFWNSTK